MGKSRGSKQRADVAELASRICDILKNRDAISADLEDEVRTTINFPIPPPTEPTTVDARACHIWNAATHILRQHENTAEDETTIASAHCALLLRVFSCLLIDAAYHATPAADEEQEQRIRCLKIGIRASRLCLAHDNPDLALKVLEKASEHVSTWESKDDSPIVRLGLNDDKVSKIKVIKELVDEYYLLRLMHALKTERLNLAEYFFDKIPQEQSTALTEKAAELYCEAGAMLLKKNRETESLRWLERAMEVLERCDSHEAFEIRLAASSYMVDCFLREGNPEAFQRAQEVIEELCSVHGFGTRLAVQMMQVRVLLARKPVPVDLLRNVLSAAIHSAVLTDHTFKMIMQYIHHACDVEPLLAVDTLANLLNDRLLPDLPTEYASTDVTWTRVEQVVVTSSLLATKHGAADGRLIDQLMRVIENLANRSNLRLSAHAAHAAQTLMWKACSLASGDVAEKWCNLLRHRIFDNVGTTNKAKVDRRAMAMALEREDYNTARELFYHVPEPARNESLTRYQAFKLALRTTDAKLAQESLQQIAKHAQGDQTILYACALEAQQSEMRSIAVVALYTITEKHPPNAQLASLLRCTARLLAGELALQHGDLDDGMDKLACVYERAANNIKMLETTIGDQWSSEVQWWSKTAYNISLQYCAENNPEHMIRLLTVCVKFIDASKTGDNALVSTSFTKRKALSHFLSATAHMVIARSANEESEGRLQNYLHARQQITAFKAACKLLQGQDHHNICKKAFAMMKFDLECILHLHQWDQLDAAIQDCLEAQDVDRWDTLADIVLIIRQHPDMSDANHTAHMNMNKLLDRIINETWHKDKDIVKASRWVRLCFSIDLRNERSEFALELLRQAANMAKKGYNRDAGVYPETELQWLATTSFNKAIDFLSAGAVDECEKWIAGALGLARYAADNGALHASLTDKHEQVQQRLRQVKV